MHSDSPNKNREISRTETFRRARVFAITSVALFLLLSMIWPISGTTFRTLVNIDIDVAGQNRDSKQWNSWLTQHIRAELSDHSLDTLTHEVQSLAPLRSTAIANSDFASIRQSISYGVKPQSDYLTIQVAFDGLGTADERQFLLKLAARVASRVANDSSSINPKHLELVNQFQRLKTAIQQIDYDAAPSSSLRVADKHNSSMPTLSGPGGVAQGQFRYASATTGSSELSVPGESIEATDVTMALDQLESLLNQHTSALRETSLASESVLGLASRTRPIDGIPGTHGMLLISFMSIVVGSVVAIHYNPFANVGLMKIESVAQTLGLPVVATIRRREPSSSGTTEQLLSTSGNWANQCASVAIRVLLGLLVIVLSSMLLNGDVRQAFFENPSYGFVQIVRVFLGY